MTVKAKKRKELRSYRLVAIASAALAGASLWIGMGLGGDGVTELGSNLTQAAAALGAAAACFSAASHTLRLRPSLDRLPAPGLAAARLGRPGLGPRPGRVDGHRAPRRQPGGADVADIGYLAAVPLLIAGVLAFPTAPMRATARLRTLLDGLLIAASLLFLGWATVLSESFRSDGGSTALERVICLAYPSATSSPGRSPWCCSPAPAAGASSTCR